MLAGGRAPESLTYAVPARLAGRIRPGLAVAAPLGARTATGLVLGPSDRFPPGRLREILGIVDGASVPAPLLELALWAARYYRAPRRSLLRVLLPPAARQSRRRRVVPTSAAAAEDAASPHGDRVPGALERAVLARLPPGGLDLRTLRAELGSGVDAAVRRLRRDGIVRTEEAEVERRVPARALALAPGAEAPARGAKRRAIHAFLAERAPRPVPRSELEAAFPGCAPVVARMVASGLLIETAPAEAAPATRPIPLASLHDEQRDAVTAIVAELGRFARFLLHGVTGSGKTEVYLAAAAAARSRGGSVLLLVPEIGLTPQLVDRAREVFGGSTFTLHSGLGEAERSRVWREVAQRPGAVVIGARSAVFAPLADLALIVVDEEHDAAYKQEETPRYHARDVAVMRAKLQSCPVVLASATPSLETYQSARSGRYRLLELPLRANRSALPTVEIVDLRPGAARDARPRPEESSPLSLELGEALIENYRAGDQSLLFLNRRGFSRFVQCRACGHVETCPECSVSLTVHRARRAAICHHCGFEKPPGVHCPECASPLAARSFGTEQVEAAVRGLLPTARIARLDGDTSASASFVRTTLEAWRRGDLDVLVGTQMIAKGHDAPGVTLIGVVLADAALSFPDFRASERAFQLLAQVSGRAGRGRKPGRVLIQTRQPDHPSLVAARAHDYGLFARGELELRSLLRYPPFGRLARIVVEGRERTAVERRAEATAASLRRLAAPAEVEVLGPAPAPLERLRGRYRHQLLVKASGAPAMAALLRAAALERRAATGETRLLVDVDPVDML